jgi:cholesterol transport system auxiliary component
MNNRLIVAGLLLLAGCSLSAPRHATTWYQLEDPGPVQRAATPVWPGTLLLRDADAPVFYQNNALAYSRESGTRGHYQYARLTEYPALQLTQLLRRRLERSGTFAAVSLLGSSVEGAYQLNTRLIDFYHDAAQAPGEEKLVLEVELVRRGDARLLAQTRIEAQAPTTSADAKGAVSAANAAVGQALDQVTAWLTGLPR